MNLETKSLRDAATRSFRGAGLHAWYTVRSKLRLDPVFLSLIERGILPDRGKLLDMGCGRGILLSLLVAARDQYLSGKWPRHWSPPPLHLSLHGLDISRDALRTARQALGSHAHLDRIDIGHADLGSSAAIVFLDVLFYLHEEDQWRVLGKAAAALDPGGVLVIREADAGAGIAFCITQCAERLAAMASGRGWQSLHYRPVTEWAQLLETLGLSVSTESMSAGTPFANVLLVARRRSIA